jgi:ParB family chromosome partitioning protein
MVPIVELYPFENHPYRVVDDTKMDELVESIKDNGVLEPAIVRKRSAGGYEIISGHRRKRACELVGVQTMPVFIKELSDDEAAVMMVDANNQREELLFSEKAWAYRIKHEALKHQGKKKDFDSSEQIGMTVGESGRHIKRYIRLTYLIKGILDLVDDEKIKFLAGERLSYLDKEEQEILLQYINANGVYPSMEIAAKLKQLSMDGDLTELALEQTLLNRKKENRSITMSAKTLRKYFSDDVSKEEIEQIIIELLEKRNRGL